MVAEAELPTDHTLVVETTTLEVVLDPAKVERIVENLIVNAARHTPAGTTIWVRVTDQPDGVLLEIDDDGPGVPAQDRELIFRPFQHGDHTLSTGIGLALVAHIAALHGGRAWVQDRPGGGAAFRVLLPGDRSV